MTRIGLRTEPFAEAEAWMRAIGAAWNRRLASLRDLVESPDLGVAPTG